MDVLGDEHGEEDIFEVACSDLIIALHLLTTTASSPAMRVHVQIFTTIYYILSFATTANLVKVNLRM